MKRNSGFTLIELIVSIGILSVLSLFLLATLDPVGQYQKAEDARRKSDLSHIQKALEAYYQDNERYPATTGDPNFFMTTSDSSDPIKEWGTNWGSYIQIIPQDKGTRKYIYASSDGQSYYIYTSLQRGSKDPQVCNNGNACQNVPVVSGVAVSCGSSASDICNYGVSSSNVSP